MIISSIVLFFKRDCAAGGGPTVDAPRAEPPAAAPVVVPAVAVGAVVVGPEVAVVAGVVPVVVVAAVLGGCVVAVDSAGFPNNPPAVPGWVVDGAVVVVLGAVVAAGLGDPKRPVEGAAGVLEGAADEVVPPREGKRDGCVVPAEVAVVSDGWLVVVPRDGEAGFAVSAPGALKSEDVWVPEVPPVDGAGAVPKRGFAAPSAVVVGVVESAGLSLPRFENRPPPLGADGAVPNVGVGFCCGVDPKRPPDEGCWVAPPNKDGLPEVGAVVDGVVDELVVFKLPKRPPGFCAGWLKSDGVCPAAVPWGGGPAGVVDALPKRPPPDAPGVAVLFPRRPPPGLPKSPPVLACPVVEDSFGFGVCDPALKRGDVPD